MRLETKTVAAKVTEAKADGTATALVSVFGNVDLGGDRVIPGAFTRSLDEWRAKGDPMPVIWSHDWDNPESFVGWADPNAIEETEAGLVVPMQFDLDRPRAEQVHHLLKTRRVTQFSFGYFARAWNDVDDPDYGAVRELTDIDLFEVGPTLLGMNPETELLQAASAIRARKAGRVLSAKNEERIRSAYEALGNVLSALAERDEPKAFAASGKAWVSEAATDLPIDETSPWDGPAAAARVFAWAGFDGDSPDPDRARQAFLVYDDSAPELRGSYKLGFADYVDGELIAVAAGLRAAASRLPQTDASPEALARAREVLDGYFERLSPEEASKATPEEAVEGAFVTWVEGDDAMVGRIEHVMTEGVLGVPESSFQIEATPDDPAILIRLFDEDAGVYVETELFMGARASQVRVIDDPTTASEDLPDTNTAETDDVKATTDSPASAGDTQGNIPGEQVMDLLTRTRHQED